MDSFEKVAKTSEIPQGDMMLVEVGGERILLSNLDGDICAISEVCSHALAYLSDGWIEGDSVECPIHGSKFNLKTGAVSSPPATEDLPTYQVRLEGDDILIGPPNP